MENVYRHPEWKRLYDAILPLVQKGQKFFTYPELTKLAGIDAISDRGRKQVLRCFVELLRDRNLHFENVKNEGYRLVDSSEHASCGNVRLHRARRRVQVGREIVQHTDVGDLTAEQRTAAADVLVRLARVEETLKEHGIEIRKILARPERPPHPLLDKNPDEKPRGVKGGGGVTPLPQTGPQLDHVPGDGE